MSAPTPVYPDSHATMCNAGGCFTPWCTCTCHHLSTITALNEDIRALAALTVTPATPRYRVVVTLAVFGITGQMTEVEVAQRWYSVATANDGARAILASFGDAAVRARVSLVRGVKDA